MKAVLFVISFLLIFFQSFGKLISSFGINSGFSNSTVTWEQEAYNQEKREIEMSELISFNISAYMEFCKKRNWSLEVGIGYLEKGHSDTEGEWRLEKKVYPFFSTTLTANGNINLGNFEPFILVGPRFDYRIGEDEFLSGLSNQAQNSELISNKYPKVNFGLNGGFGVRYKLKKILFGIKYQKLFTFNKLVEYKEADTPPYYLALSDKTWSLNLIMGFRIN